MQRVEEMELTIGCFPKAQTFCPRFGFWYFKSYEGKQKMNKRDYGFALNLLCVNSPFYLHRAWTFTKFILT